ncbi:hypothetical protein AX769_10590 [Frondihabitans sp. PAMC 28766]|uniref:alpha/beta fold hydrolase n=1 Tax=Frondihabitans sp. PAMC 28766 TaxID=1795630 RepID=UPI00078E6454|nr:alpha/beta fold hydrolase [Frondihabitans sp. PAMC 28766]AMM20514.1 hypothetical protein AX769_10590 [Frondihabitans sp. PAMC 28766]
MADWSDDDPGAGDMAAIELLASRLADDEHSAAGISSVLAGALGAVPSFWSGSGAETWSRTAGRQKADLVLLSNAGESASRAARRYASEVEDIARLARVQIAALGEARLALGRTYADDPAALPDDDEVRRRQRLRDDAADDAAYAAKALSGLVAQREKADATFVSALRSVLPATWPAEKAAFATLGVSHPDRVSVRDIDRLVDDYVHRLQRDSNSVSAEQATALLVFAERGDVPPERVLSLLESHPALASALTHVDSNVVAAWWRGLDDPGSAAAGLSRSAPQRALVAAVPSALGNLNGVAYGARDSANRAVLAKSIASTEAEIAAMKESGAPIVPWFRNEYDTHLGVLQRRLESLENIQDSLDSPRGSAARRQLVSLTSDEPPLAAVSIGDLDRAASVTYMVPGMGSSTREITGWARASQNLYDQQFHATSILNLAVVAWVGYKSPAQPSPDNPDLGVLSSRKAQEGANRLADDLSGLNATRRGSTVSLNVVGHSYGTTTASLALAQHRLHVDSFVSVASAGIDRSIGTASDIHASHVFAEQARDSLPLLEDGKGDQWAWVGRAGGRRDNPMDPGFGAVRMDVNGVLGDESLRGITAHDQLVHDDLDSSSGYGYFDNMTESLKNVALATTGQGSRAPPFLAPQQRDPVIELLDPVTGGGAGK